VDTTLNIVSCDEVRQQQQLYSLCQQTANTGPQTTATSKLFDFICLTLQCILLKNVA